MKNYRSSVLLTTLLTLVLFSGGCGINTFLDENRVWAEPKLAALEDIYKVAYFLPSVPSPSQSEIETFPVFKGTQADVKGEKTESSHKWNADIVFIEELKDIETLVPNGLGITYDHSWFLQTSNLLRKGFLRKGLRVKDLETVKKYFSDLKAMKYVLVIKAKVVPPQKAQGNGYSLGSVLGTAILFDIERSSNLGSFPVSINSSSFVTVAGNKVKEDLAINLASDFERAITQGMIQYFTTSVHQDLKP